MNRRSPASKARRGREPSRRRVWGAAALALALIAGCARRPAAPPPGVPVPLAEAAARVEALRAESQSVARYQAIVRARGRGPEGGFSANLVLIFERPGSVRVELLGPFGGSRWVAVAQDGAITVLFPGPNEYLTEPRVEDVVGALLGVPLGPAQLMAVLSGTGVDLEGAAPTAAVRRGDVVRIDLGGTVLELEAEQVRRAVHPEYQVVYPGNWKSERRQVPRRLELESERVRATLVVEELEVNVPLHPESFALAVPEGATRLRLAQIGDEAVFVQTER